MKKVGLTGGIGSGKTVVATIFKCLGIPVYNSDERAKALYFVPSVKEAVIKLLGNEAYIDNSTLNKAFVSSIIFSDKKKLEALNGIIHPAVGKDFEDWLLKQRSAFVVKESALLFEAGIHKNMDEVIVVTADLETRIRRVMQRDRLTREQVLSRIGSQQANEEKVKSGSFVVDNSDNELVIPQVITIFQKLKVN